MSDRLVVMVFANGDPSSRLLLGAYDIVGGAYPAAISFSHANGKFYVFGTIQDARIASLQLDRVDGAKPASVSRPGFAIVRDQADSASPWRFLDGKGNVVLSGG